MSSEPCKHDCGWCVLEKVDVFIRGDGSVMIDSQGGQHAKLRAQCNLRCGEVRNVYIPLGKAKVGTTSYAGGSS